jgi:NAD(P)-dependent dehydrogenase (short-subunit alcohol dehydrogenase family)
MQIRSSVALVTGANRGIGRSFVEALLERGAAKVYAGARHPEHVADLLERQGQRHGGTVVPIKLDITVPADIAAAAGQCGDVTLLVNNAGINLQAGLIAAKDLSAARAEMETNYFGPLSMCRAFAPILAGNGGGAIINMLSILARVNLPMYGSLCASKAAALSLSQGVRAELAKQGTLVVAVMPGAVDTEMERNFPPPKLPPADAARAALDAVEQGLEEVYPGDMATGMNHGLAADPKAVEKDLAKYLPA